MFVEMVRNQVDSPRQWVASPFVDPNVTRHVSATRILPDAVSLT